MSTEDIENRSAAFKEAVVESRNLNSTLDNDELLIVNAYFGKTETVEKPNSPPEAVQ